MKTIAVDFDGLLCENKYPKIGNPKWSVINRLKGVSGFNKVVLWTCRRGKELEQALDACEQWGLRIDRVNENSPEVIKRFGSDPRKLVAMEYWDDRAVNPVAVQRLIDKIQDKMEAEPENEQVLQEVLWLIEKELGV